MLLNIMSFYPFLKRSCLHNSMTVTSVSWFIKNKSKFMNGTAKNIRRDVLVNCFLFKTLLCLVFHWKCEKWNLFVGRLCGRRRTVGRARGRLLGLFNDFHHIHNQYSYFRQTMRSFVLGNKQTFTYKAERPDIIRIRYNLRKSYWASDHDLITSQSCNQLSTIITARKRL